MRCTLVVALNVQLGRSGVKQSELRRDESDAPAHRAPAGVSSYVLCHMAVMYLWMFGLKS